ncbi:unnamed protein product, partial [Hymenolepis diminuta]
CIDVDEDVLECRPLELVSDKLEIENPTSSISKETIDTNLEESRLKYLQCKLAEILTEKHPVENFPKSIELCSPSPEMQSL